MKNGNAREFFRRGMMFGGFGSIVVCLVGYIVSIFAGDAGLSAGQQLLSVVSGCLLAFLVAGSTVFYHIEHWGLAKATCIHGLCLYVAYLACYLLNSWITPDWAAVGIFTAIFAAGYIVIWGVVMICCLATAKKLNGQLHAK